MFPERLKQTRKSHNLKQKDVAQSICVDRSTYAGYETGKNKPSFEKLLELGNLFNVSIDYLLGRTDNPILLKTTYNILDGADLHSMKVAEDFEIFREYMSMKIEDKKAVTEFIETRKLMYEKIKK